MSVIKLSPRNKLEVVSLMELGEVKAVFTRAGKFIPRYECQYLISYVAEEEDNDD